MKTKLALTTAIIAFLIVFSTPTVFPSIHPVRAEPYIDPSLAGSSSTASPLDLVEVAVTLDRTPTNADAEAIAALSRVTVPMTELPIILTTTTYGNLASIASYPGVVSLFKNRPLAFFGHIQTTTRNYGEVPVQHSWWNDVMRVPEAWALGYKGQGVTVAVVDTGVDATNPSLGFSFPNGLRFGPERVIQNVKVLTIGELLSTQQQRPPLGPDQLFIENLPNSDTTGGHGTSVSGLIAGTGAVGNGIYMGAAPEARIVGLGAGDTLLIFHVIASYNWILSHRIQYNIRIVNNSWGSDFECSLLLEGFMSDPEACRSRSPISLSTKAAHDQGIAVFFAAGNSGPTNPTINPFSEPSWVISIGAGTESKGLVEFSSRGCADASHPVCTNAAEQRPEIVAPGINVISTRASTGATDGALTSSTDTGNIVNGLQPLYTTFGGTSAASPMAAAVGALVLSAHGLSPDGLKAALQASADPMRGYLAFQVGSGHVNALNAVKAARGRNFTPTPSNVENSGIQRFVYTGFIGGEVLVTAASLSGNFPVFQGARQIIFEINWPTASIPILQWEVSIYAGNDYAVADCGRTRPDSDCIFAIGAQTGVSYSVDDPSFIASLNNPGQTAGTWDIRVFNFDQGSSVTVVVDVVY